MTENGIIANGKEYPVDLVIFGTGFEVGVGYTHQAGYEAIGRGGIKLSDKWKDGMSTQFGYMTNGFPNFYVRLNRSVVEGGQGV
jgi:cation diffusion facilitator CzcD-associated flavoprotein CzcO